MNFDEVTIGIYPWDIHDEGVDCILDTVQEKAGVNAAYLIALMHHEKRPLHDTYYPHNPVRKQYITEDSRAYWQPDPSCYRESRIKPRLTDRAFLQGTDWLRVLTEALRRHGMHPQAEISHTPLDTERAETEFPDCVQRDIYGNALASRRHLLCWNSDDAREYMYALLTDLAANYDLDMIQTCTILHDAGNRTLHPFLGITLGGCFCENCARKAKEKGIDWEAVTRTVRYYADAVSRRTVESNEDRLLLERGDTTPVKFLLEHPELYDWLKFRCDSITEHFRGMYAAVKSADPSIDFRFNSCWPEAEYIGQNLTEIKDSVDSVRLMAYHEQSGDPSRMPHKGRWISNARRELGPDKKLVSSVAIRAKATPELIHEGIRLAAKNGADALSLAFWDGASMEQLSAVKSGMEAAEVTLREVEVGGNTVVA